MSKYFYLLLLSYFSQNRETPLHLAARSGNEMVIELLLKAGADPSAVDGVRENYIYMYFTFRQVKDFLKFSNGLI